MCRECDGKGYVSVEEVACKRCKGAGKIHSFTVGEVSEKSLMDIMNGGGVCPDCGGTGKVERKIPCPVCGGKGEVGVCKVCGGEAPLGQDVCSECSKKKVVYVLDSVCDVGDIRIGMLLSGIVSSKTDFGMFVMLNPSVRGLMRKTNYEIGDRVVVRVKNIHPNGNIDLEPVNINDYRVVELEKPVERVSIDSLSSKVGTLVGIEGEVMGVRQTQGPTIFTVADETGSVQCAGFEGAGVRAYPHIDVGSVVRIVGDVLLRNGTLQLEIRSIKRLWGEEALIVKEKLREALEKRCTPPKIEFLVKSEYLEKLRSRMEKVAKELLMCAYTSRPVIIRHHADADGITAAVCIEQALLPIVREINGKENSYYLLKRSPSRAPFYEMTDIIKDLSFALEDQERYEQKLPLILLVDNGSTLEDVPALRYTRMYGVDVIVVDHHHPDPEVDEYLLEHVNPAHVEADYNITTGILCLEIARMINPSITDTIMHLASVSVLGDRAEGEEARKYLELALEKYSHDELKNMALAVDYLSYWLRFSEGRHIVNDVLNLSGRPERHRKVLEALASDAKVAIEESVEACMHHVKTTKLPNGIVLNVIDVGIFSHKFTFPPPGKMVGEIHDRLCKEGEPTITIGYGPDFAVMRSRGVEMNFPLLVRELQQELKEGGISGGGHLVVGSIKFFEGMRKEVLKALAEKIGRMEGGENG